MDTEIKTEWVKRLRDGRKQTKEVLQNEKGQCCLGVLCEMALEQGVVTATEYESNHYGTVINYVDPNGNMSYEELPLAVKDWADLSRIGTFPGSKVIEYGNGSWTSLAELNDAGMPFEEIAQVIEENF